jgi:hypothetical protein
LGERAKVGWLEVMFGEAQPDEQVHVGDDDGEDEVAHWPFRQLHAIKDQVSEDEFARKDETCRKQTHC